MKEKMAKLKNVYHKYGFFGFLKKSFSYVKANYFSRSKFDKVKTEKLLDTLCHSKKYDRVILWRSSFGWNVPLFQRPQHIAKELADQKCLVLYEVTTMTDKVEAIKKVKNNLYLVNLRNRKFAKMFHKYVSKIQKPKYLQFYSTDYTLSVKDVKKYQNLGFEVIYEYIDDLNPSIAGVKKLPKNVQEKYDLAMQDKSVFVVVTASLLEDDVISKRGNRRLCYACNGVDYDFFQNIDKKFPYDKNFRKIFDEKLPTVGYYGAIASWFDYDLIKKLAQTNKYNIILFGVIYDDYYRKSGIGGLAHVHFMGSVDYKVLKNYAAKIDVLTIPFIINDITRATSPLKVFEYMALHKPIVTTDMLECRKYDSVMIGHTHQEFVNLVSLATKMNAKKDKEYFKTLDKEAKANTWEVKAKTIVNMLRLEEEKK